MVARFNIGTPYPLTIIVFEAWQHSITTILICYPWFYPEVYGYIYGSGGFFSPLLKVPTDNFDVILQAIAESSFYIHKKNILVVKSSVGL